MRNFERLERNLDEIELREPDLEQCRYLIRAAIAEHRGSGHVSLDALGAIATAIAALKSASRAAELKSRIQSELDSRQRIREQAEAHAEMQTQRLDRINESFLRFENDFRTATELFEQHIALAHRMIGSIPPARPEPPGIFSH